MLRPEGPEGAAPRRERNAAATQQRLLDAAEHAFARHGFAGARLRDIAVGAGVQPALIHHYFADKQGLYRAVLDRALVQTSDASWKVLGSRRDVAGLIEGFVDVLVDFYAAHTDFIAILRHESQGGSSVTVEVLRARSLPVIEVVRAFLRAHQATGEVRSDIDPDDMILAALSMVAHPFSEAGLVEAVMPGTTVRDAAALVRRKRAITALLLGALAPPT